MDSDKVNLVIKQGDTFRAAMTTTQLDFDGCTGKMQLRTDYADLGGELVWEMTTDNGGVTFPAHGPDEPATVSLYIPDTVTRDFIANMRGVYDLEVVFLSGDKFTIMEGSFRIKPDTTV